MLKVGECITLTRVINLSSAYSDYPVKLENVDLIDVSVDSTRTTFLGAPQKVQILGVFLARWIYPGRGG